MYYTVGKFPVFGVLLTPFLTPDSKGRGFCQLQTHQAPYNGFVLLWEGAA
jgi:hypothetical protein